MSSSSTGAFKRLPVRECCARLGFATTSPSFDAFLKDVRQRWRKSGPDPDKQPSELSDWDFQHCAAAIFRDLGEKYWPSTSRPSGPRSVPRYTWRTDRVYLEGWLENLIRAQHRGMNKNRRRLLISQRWRPKQDEDSSDTQITEYEDSDGGESFSPSLEPRPVVEAHQQSARLLEWLNGNGNNVLQRPPENHQFPSVSVCE